MSSTRKAAVSEALEEILVPIAQLMHVAGMGIGDLAARAKVASVRAAVERMRASGRSKPNVSRIAVETGMYRAEVSAILKQKTRSPPPFRRGHARAERVLSGWWTDPEFLDDDGRPLPLKMRGPAPSFVTLVERYGASNPQPVLKTLVRAGAVRERDETYRAIRSSCAQIDWSKESISEVGLQLQTHLDALLQNLASPNEERQFVRFFQSDAIDEMQARVLARDLRADGQLFMENANDRLSHKRYSANICDKGTLARQFSVGIQIIETTLDPEARKSSRHSRFVRLTKAKPREA